MSKIQAVGGIILMVIILTSAVSFCQTLEYVNSMYWTGVNDIKVRGDYAYCCFGAGLVIYDLTSIGFPQLSSKLFIQGSNKHIQLDGNYVYLYGNNDKIRIVDITSPLAPEIKSELAIDAEINDICISDSYIFAAAGELGLAIIDIANPEQPELLTLYDTDGITGTVDYHDNFVYMAEKEASPSSPTFFVIDISDIYNPYALGTITDQIVEATDLIVDDNYAYLADQSAGFTAIDLTDLTDPQILVQLTGTTAPHNLHAFEQYIFMDKDHELLQVYDISDPASPQLAGDYLPEKPLMNFDLYGVQLFTAGGFEGISILDAYDVSYIFELGEIDRMGAITSSFMMDDILYLSEAHHGFMLHDLSLPDVPNLIYHIMTPYEYYFSELNNSSIFLLQEDQIGEIYIPDPTTPYTPMYANMELNYTDVCIDLPYIYMVKPGGGVDIYRRHSFVALQYLNSYEWSSSTGNVVVENNRAYISQYPYIYIFDSSDPTDSVLFGSFEPANQIEYLWVNDDIVYSSGYSDANNLVSIYDCADPENPALLNEINFPGSVLDIQFIDNMAIFSVSEYGIFIYDYTDPENLVLIDSFRTPDTAKGITIHGDYLYIADNSSLVILRFSPTDIEDKNNLPAEYSLIQNYPNPFNAQTVISYSIPEQSEVKLDIYDVLGRKVETLIDGNQTAGTHQVIWNASDVSSGVYFYKLTAGEYKQAQKMLLVK